MVYECLHVSWALLPLVFYHLSLEDDSLFSPKQIPIPPKVGKWHFTVPQIMNTKAFLQVDRLYYY